MITFKNRKFQVKTERVRLPNGDSVDFTTIVKRPGTNLIPFVDKDTILMINQYRPAVKRWILQLSGGKVEESETPMQNAVKELEEELGYVAEKMRMIGKFYSVPHMSDEQQYVFIATGLKKTKRHLEKGELIRTRRVKVKDALRMARSGKINDSITISALMMLEDRLK